VKPRIWWHDEAKCWAADNGYSTSACDTWNEALLVVASWYGWRGHRWARLHLAQTIGRKTQEAPK
jgi:hypothetical protein